MPIKSNDAFESWVQSNVEPVDEQGFANNERRYKPKETELPKPIVNIKAPDPAEEDKRRKRQLLEDPGMRETLGPELVAQWEKELNNVQPSTPPDATDLSRQEGSGSLPSE